MGRRSHFENKMTVELWQWDHVQRCIAKAMKFCVIVNHD